VQKPDGDATLDAESGAEHELDGNVDAATIRGTFGVSD